MLFSTLSTKKRYATLIALVALICLGACASNTATDVSQRRQIRDDSGVSVSLPAKVDRVVSLAPNLTEIVFAIGAGHTLVGRTSYCNFPAEANSVTPVGDTLHPSLERIVSVKPQVVLISTASQLEVFTKQLQSHGIAVFVTDPRELEGVFRTIVQVGEIVGDQDKANALVAKLRERTTAVQEKVKDAKPVRVFYQLSAQPLFTAGKEAFVTDLIRRAGGISVTGEVPGAWPKYSAEAALATHPDAIILPTGGSMGDGNTTVADALKGSPAAVQGKVYKINDDHLVRPGPRAVDGLEEMARALHPDLFKQL